MRVGVDFDHRARLAPPPRSPRRGRPRSRRGPAGAGPVGWPSIVTRGFATARTIRSRHLVTRHAEARMDAGHHVVEPVEHLVGVVERAVGQDVALGPLEEAERVAELRVQGVDRGPLLADPLDRQPAGVAGRLASGRRSPGTSSPAARAASAISSSVAPPSLQSVWQWNVPVRSLAVDQARAAGPRSARSISPWSSRSSGGIYARPSAAKRSASVRQATGPSGPSRAYSFSV